ncbi:MAG TPA: penicillin-insensitive murein endopeptidase [Polyangiaceae bacterium]|nr:penicillin-insensitive murein endopeptidase [Polyangiaceae bacterium]
MRGLLKAGTFASVFGLALAALAAPESPWSRAKGPAGGPALSIGGYSAGCVQGAKELPLTGVNYTVMKPERHRNFGHPALVAFVVDIGKALEERHLAPLGVGDLGQARGGPAPNGHASHQNGLDVDLWFSPGGPNATQQPMVDLLTNKPSPHYGERVPALLELAAKDARVARIFVNAVIKRELCEKTTGDRAWLSKLRPWHGHHEHFHVRLACPADSPECQAQPPIPAGDGCNELDWWLSPESAKDRSKAGDTYGKRVGAQPKLPDSCEKLAKAPDAR